MRKAAMVTMIAALAGTAGIAEAGVMGRVVSAVSGEVIALAISAAVALLAGTCGLLFARVTRTFRETGEFLTVLGCALEDHRITREELAEILKSGRDVFTVWK